MNTCLAAFFLALILPTTFAAARAGTNSPNRTPDFTINTGLKIEQWHKFSDTEVFAYDDETYARFGEYIQARDIWGRPAKPQRVLNVGVGSTRVINSRYWNFIGNGRNAIIDLDNPQSPAIDLNEICMQIGQDFTAQLGEDSYPFHCDAIGGLGGLNTPWILPSLEDDHHIEIPISHGLCERLSYEFCRVWIASFNLVTARVDKFVKVLDLSNERSPTPNLLYFAWPRYDDFTTATLSPDKKYFATLFSRKRSSDFPGQPPSDQYNIILVREWPTGAPVVSAKFIEKNCSDIKFYDNETLYLSCANSTDLLDKMTLNTLDTLPIQKIQSEDMREILSRPPEQLQKSSDRNDTYQLNVVEYRPGRYENAKMVLDVVETRTNQVVFTVSREQEDAFWVSYMGPALIDNGRALYIPGSDGKISYYKIDPSSTLVPPPKFDYISELLLTDISRGTVFRGDWTNACGYTLNFDLSAGILTLNEVAVYSPIDTCRTAGRVLVFPSCGEYRNLCTKIPNHPDGWSEVRFCRGGSGFSINFNDFFPISSTDRTCSLSEY